MYSWLNAHKGWNMEYLPHQNWIINYLFLDFAVVLLSLKYASKSFD